MTCKDILRDLASLVFWCIVLAMIVLLGVLIGMMVVNLFPDLNLFDLF